MTNSHLIGNLMTLVGILPPLLGVLFLLLIMFGFFERRENGHYRFRPGRFVATVFALLIINMSLVVPAIELMRELVTLGFNVAETAILKNRAIEEYTLENMGAVLPDILNGQTQQCYRAALSNYVEDKWNESFHDGLVEKNPAACKSDPSICPNKQEDYPEAIRARINPYHLLFQDLATAGYLLGSDWIAAAGSYKNQHRLFYLPDGKGQKDEPPDQHMWYEYQRYLDNCSSLTPMPWAMPDGQLLKSKSTVCVGACP